MDAEIAPTGPNSGLNSGLNRGPNPGRPRAATAGFSLIELLVAVAIVSVLAVGVSLVASRSTAPGGSEAARFERGFTSQRQLAIGSQQMRGWQITPRDHRPMVRGPSGWQGRGRASRWQEPVSFVARGAPLPTGWPEIVFLPNGRTSAFRIRFGRGNASIVCDSDGVTGLTCADA